MREKSHNPALDGLRGAAVLAVLILHFTPSLSHFHAVGQFALDLTRAGWAGVNLFFVLSGFLITGILIDAKGKPLALRNFYMRRVLRIFPLYYVALIIFALGGGCGYDWWLWLYSANVPLIVTGQQVLTSGPFDLNHFWSLAIEEHFYFVWPFVVLTCGKRGLIATCVGVMLVACASRAGLILAGVNHLAPYVATFTRADALALGGLLAVLRDRLPSLRRLAVAVVGFSSCVLVAWIACRGRLSPLEPAVQLVAFPLFDWLSAGLLVLAVTGAGSLWSTRPLRFFGKLSYGLYVYHYLLMSFFDRWFPMASVIEWSGSFSGGILLRTCLGIGFSVLPALVSWYCLEAPCQRLKKHFV